MKLKEDLDSLYREWQEKIESRNVNSSDLIYAGRKILRYICRIQTQRKNLEYKILNISDEKIKEELELLILEVEQFQVQLFEKFGKFCVFVNGIVNEKKRLGSRIIQQFERFTADESFVGDQCVICMEEIELGRNMMRLNCDGQHTFCQVCIERWFEGHKTCPTCRHAF